MPGHPLALTLPYAPADKRDALVALSAVIGEIASVPGDVSDPGVARRKLGWWREALAEGDGAGGDGLHQFAMTPAGIAVGDDTLLGELVHSK